MTSRSQATAPDRWLAARELLCVRLDTIGDVLMSGPAMRALANDGARRITLLTSPTGAAAGALMPEVDAVIPYEAPWVKVGSRQPDAEPDRQLGSRQPDAEPNRQLGSPRPDADPDRQLIERLRARRFDAAVIFTVSTQSALPAALLCLLAEVPLRLAHCREKPYRLLTDWIAEPEPAHPSRHEVRRQLDLVAAVSAHTDDERLRVRVADDAVRRVAALLDEIGIDRRRPWLVAHPGSSAPSRRCPPELLAEACRTLVGEHGLQVVLSGDEADRALVEEVRRRSSTPLASLAGRLDLGELAALLDAAPLLVAANSGPVHLAAAVGTPVVDIYALTNPQHTPWGVPSIVLSNDVPCRWCYASVCPQGHQLCLRGLMATQLVDAVLELLRAPRSTPAVAPFHSPSLG